MKIKMSSNLQLPFSCLIALVVCLVVKDASGQEVPGAPQSGPIAIVGGTVHTISGESIDNGMVLFEKGKITGVGQKLKLPTGTKVVSVKGKHVYPGMFESHSQLGLTEIASIQASLDSNETGSINPNVKAYTAVNPESALIPVTRANGVLLALSAPQGGTIAGQASVLQMDGWTNEDLTLVPAAGMIVRLPAPKSDAMNRLVKLLSDARRYAKLRKNQKESQKKDLRLQALSKMTSGKIPMIAYANRVDQISAAVGFAKKEGLKVIILGGYDAADCADLLNKNQVPVIVTSTHRTPMRRSDAYDSSYSLPKRLKDAGVKFCISGSGRSETWNARNLPYHAATAVAFGLDSSDALKAITLWPAEILGVDDRLGSIQKGKDATLFVSSGSPLEISSNVQMAWIQGRKVELSSKHVRLWKKYQQKYRQKARQKNRSK